MSACLLGPHKGGAHFPSAWGVEEYISHLNHSGKPADLPQAGVLQCDTPGPPSRLVAAFFCVLVVVVGAVIYYSNEIRSSRWQKKGQGLAGRKQPALYLCDFSQSVTKSKVQRDPVMAAALVSILQ